MGIIYKYTNKKNGKIYIGQTINPSQRFNQHKSSAFNERDKSYNYPLHRAFRKYGIEQFDYEVIASTEDTEALNLLERYFIEKFDSIKNGYNILEGGLNSTREMKDETKLKLTFSSRSELTKEEVIELRIAYQNHLSPSEIYNNKYKDRLQYASFMNIWSGKRYGMIMPEVFEEKRRAKLNEEIVYNIRLDRIKENLSYEKLASKYNISKSTISDIINNRTWKQVQIEPVSTIPESGE